MKSRNYSYGAALVCTLVLGLGVFVTAPAAQNRGGNDPAADKPTPKMADGHPDFTGFWLDNVAGLSYGADAGQSEDGNLQRLPDGSTIFLYGGAEAGVPREAPVSDAVPKNAPP